MWLLAGVLTGSLAACASAGSRTDNPPDASPPVDTPTVVDTPMDMGPTAVTLQQTTDNTIAAGNSIACSNSSNLTAEESWYRVFSLDEAGVTGTFSMQSVTFAAETTSGSPTITVKVGTYAGALDEAALDLAKITPVATGNLAVTPTTTGTSNTVPLTGSIPAGSLVIVEVQAPNLQNTVSDNFFIGTTAGSFTHTAYLRAPDCGAASPQSMVSLGFTASQAIITVDGTF